MTRPFLLIYFGFIFASALLSNDLQSVVNFYMIPSDLAKMKMAHPSWQGETIFEKLTPIAGLFSHKETSEIILETKNKLWTENEIIENYLLENSRYYHLDEIENFIEARNWEGLFFRSFGWPEFRTHWNEALAELVHPNGIFDGKTMLEKAADELWDDDANVIRILLQREADANVCCKSGWQKLPPLHIAAKWDHVEAIELLMRFGANINLTANDRTPLMLAVKHLSHNAAEELLKHGPSEIKKTLDIAESTCSNWKGSYEYQPARKIAELLRAHAKQKKKATNCCCRKNEESVKISVEY